MRLLYLVRHGHHVKSDVEESDGNENGALSDEGREQARLLGDRLRPVEFEAVRHSTLHRARETAELLALDAPLVGDDELRECVPHRPPDAELSDAHRKWFAGWPEPILEHGAQQAASLLDRFTGHEDGPLLLVTHGNIISWLVVHATGAPPARWLGMLHYNCALTVIGYREGRPPLLVAYNDAGHLPLPLRGTDYPPEFRV